MNFRFLYEGNSKPSRLSWIAYAKGIAIILVVYRHVLGGFESAGIQSYEYLTMVQQSVYNFRMPLFFILAGLFVRKSLKKRSTNVFFSYKLNTIMYPYFIWACIQLTFQLVFSRFANDPKSWSDYLYIFYSPRHLDQLWFLYALFLVSVLFAFIHCYLHLNRSQQMVLGIVLYYFSTLSIVKEISLLQDVFHFYLFFAFGNIIAETILNQEYKTIFASKKVMFMLLPFFLVSQWYWVNHLGLKESNPFLFAIIAIIGSILVFNISFILEKANVLRFIEIIGNHSLYIYIMHVIIQAGVRGLMVNLLGIDSIIILLPVGVAVSILLPIIIYNLSMQQGLWFLYNYEKPKVHQKQVAL